ncbi:MAG: hypothetical protein KGM17_12735 [Sphingomonadales bacterium]|nr:hypothetical protein [Sphingomonadales bacterium]
MRRILALAASAALIVMPGMARAAEAPCLTPMEFTALATYALPSVVTGTAQRCTPALPRQSFLATQGPALAQRYAASKPAAWPGAKAAFLKLAGGSTGEAASVLRSLPDPQLQQLADAAIAAKLGDTVPVDRCGSIDRLLKLLSPLPSETTAEVVMLAVGLGAAAGQARIGRISVCPA